MPNGDGAFSGADPWAAGGEWLRCALHAHTTESDIDRLVEALENLLPSTRVTDA